jgi:MFS family permease
LSIHTKAILIGSALSFATGTLLSAFFYGYLTTQLLGGWLATRYGSKPVMLAGVLGPSLLTLLTPVLAPYSDALIALRVLEGVVEVCLAMVFLPSLLSISYLSLPLITTESEGVIKH